jgi:hypothetical protein
MCDLAFSEKVGWAKQLHVYTGMLLLLACMHRHTLTWNLLLPDKGLAERQMASSFRHEWNTYPWYACICMRIYDCMCNVHWYACIFMRIYECMCNVYAKAECTRAFFHFLTCVEHLGMRVCLYVCVPARVCGAASFVRGAPLCMHLCAYL